MRIYRGDTFPSPRAWLNERVKLDAPPTVRQVYALAAILCQMVDQEFPKDREGASALIERFRRELGHPSPRLEDSPRRGRRGRASDVLA